MPNFSPPFSLSPAQRSHDLRTVRRDPVPAGAGTVPLHRSTGARTLELLSVSGGRFLIRIFTPERGRTGRVPDMRFVLPDISDTTARLPTPTAPAIGLAVTTGPRVLHPGSDVDRFVRFAVPLPVEGIPVAVA